MSKRNITIVLSYFLLLTFYFSSSAICQVSETKTDSIKKYDEIIDLNSLESIKVVPEEKPEELALLLPKLDSGLYTGWTLSSEPEVTKPEDKLLLELRIEKILKQSYKKENHLVDVLIYKFKDFTSAYSAYTVLHSGATTKLKAGKNASESEKLVNFWKDSYFVDVHTQSDNDTIAKEFIILSSQEISKNIKTDQLPPIVAIQLPALNRIPGSEKYCLGPVCCSKFFTFSEFDPESFNLLQSGGIIQAQYQLSDNPKDKERIILVLTRYINKENAQSVFNALKEKFEKKKSEDKEIQVDVDIKDSILKVKNKKKDYTFIKQRGNLLAIAYDVTDKKAGEKILDLVPWPIEITR